MSEWPITVSLQVPDEELPEGLAYATREVKCISADLGRELAEELRQLRHAFMGSSMESDQPSPALERYEREVGK